MVTLAPRDLKKSLWLYSTMSYTPPPTVPPPTRPTTSGVAMLLGETQGVLETWARKLLLLLLRCRLSVRRRFRGEDEGRSRARDEASFDVAA